MRSCENCRHIKTRSFFGGANDYDYCELRNGWPISRPVIRALTCPAYENAFKLVEDWRELHDVDVDE